jgi:hypothetical protein
MVASGGVGSAAVIHAIVAPKIDNATPMYPAMSPTQDKVH